MADSKNASEMQEERNLLITQLKEEESEHKRKREEEHSFCKQIEQLKAKISSLETLNKELQGVNCKHESYILSLVDEKWRLNETIKILLIKCDDLRSELREKQSHIHHLNEKINDKDEELRSRVESINKSENKSRMETVVQQNNILKVKLSEKSKDLEKLKEEMRRLQDDKDKSVNYKDGEMIQSLQATTPKAVSSPQSFFNATSALAAAAVATSSLPQDSTENQKRPLQSSPSTSACLSEMLPSTPGTLSPSCVVESVGTIPSTTLISIPEQVVTQSPKKSPSAALLLNELELQITTSSPSKRSTESVTNSEVSTVSDPSQEKKAAASVLCGEKEHSTTSINAGSKASELEQKVPFKHQSAVDDTSRENIDILESGYKGINQAFEKKEIKLDTADTNNQHSHAIEYPDLDENVNEVQMMNKKNTDDMLYKKTPLPSTILNGVSPTYPDIKKPHSAPVVDRKSKPSSDLIPKPSSLENRTNKSHSANNRKNELTPPQKSVPPSVNRKLKNFAFNPVNNKSSNSKDPVLDSYNKEQSLTKESVAIINQKLKEEELEKLRLRKELEAEESMRIEIQKEVELLLSKEKDAELLKVKEENGKMKKREQKMAEGCFSAEEPENTNDNKAAIQDQENGLQNLEMELSSKDTAQNISGGGVKLKIFLFISKHSPFYKSKVKIFRSVSEEFKRKVSFVTINTDDDDNEKYMKLCGVKKEDVPTMRFVKFAEDMIALKPLTTGITADIIKKFVTGALQGNIKRYVLSEDIPEGWDKEPVKVLVGETFDEVALDSSKNVLVEFFSPLCGHFKELDKLGEKYKDNSNVVIAKMNGIANKLLHTEINSFPTIKLYKKDTNEVVEYNGERTLEGISQFIETDGEYGKAAPDEPSLTRALKSVDGNSSLSRDHSFNNDPSTLPHTSNIAETAAVENCKAGRKAAKNRDRYLRRKKKTAQKTPRGDTKPQILLFISKDSPYYEREVEIFCSAAKEFKSKVIFVTINTDDEGKKEYMKLFGVKKEDVPTIRFVKCEEKMMALKPLTSGITADIIKEFVTSALEGNIKRCLCSEDIPEGWDKEPVKVLVGETFDEVALDSSKNVLVEFFSPLCGHFKELDKLGEKYKDNSNVVIAKMNGIANKLLHTEINSFPTIKLYKQETNEVVDFNGEHTLEGISRFIESGGVDGAAVKEEKKDEPAAPSCVLKKESEAASTLPLGHIVAVTPEQLQAYRWEREIDERNRPFV